MYKDEDYTLPSYSSPYRNTNNKAAWMPLRLVSSATLMRL